MLNFKHSPNGNHTRDHGPVDEQWHGPETAVEHGGKSVRRGGSGTLAPGQEEQERPEPTEGATDQYSNVSKAGKEKGFLLQSL